MNTYIHRPIADVLLNAKRKVVILEGARAVGKTLMAESQLVPAGFSYETLADMNTFELAQHDLSAWLKSLNLPVIIDEAQRIPSLPLEIKETVDKIASQGIQFLLTGSAIISRSGLDGQDPLARRAQRFTMSPLTQGEFHHIPGSIVDDLWSAEPNTNFEQETPRAELYDLMAAGGFPEYSGQYPQYEEWERERLIADDIQTVLGDTILPDEKLDAVIAGSILSKLLCMPGGILNASAMGDSLALDRRTVDRYISIFIRRFLIHALPNIRTAPNRQSFTRSKIHPIDTSLSVQTMLSKGTDPLMSPVAYGNLLESFVINQIVPAIQWSQTHPDCFYWREPGNHPKEVDLVIARRQQLVGVEVKSSSTIKRDDFKGLAELAKDSRFLRGYLVYTGSKIMRWADNLWVLPVSALWNSAAFTR
ncbi:ATP-binding protein [Bifidobacterium sp.]|jgi:predicted AAA+ superfamily ATPase|uniref:ATP-binding protein n=1 Tax=Bifidobacterium sp. TaxID=41200 RepID=UPI0025C5AD64|nr:AAA family ATPase [Bifidobacterium sp.]MCI1634775.1 AAA family ATPase [Bifidobacterium sp.]